MRSLFMPTDDVDSLTRDGRIVHVRDIDEADLAALQALHDRASDRSIYFRFFNPGRESARRYVTGLARANDADHHGIGAFAGGELVALAVFDRVGAAEAEFALLVADDWQHAGLGTMLLEHLIAEARASGIERFVAEVLSANVPMLQVMRDLGIPASSKASGGETHLEFDLRIDDQSIAAIAAREQAADVASLRPLLAPSSVVVIGAGRRPGTVGNEVLRNIVEGDFTGEVWCVNPHADSIHGVRCARSVDDLTASADLAVIALPAALVNPTLEACGRRGIRAAILLGGGFGESGAAGARLQEQALATARRLGIRLLGPNCIGLVNTDPDIRLNATFANLAPRAGQLAVLAQSGAFGVGLAAAADRAGVGLAQFVSVGNKADVGGNDVLPVWAVDPRVKVVAAYLESVGDPRRFVRIARSISARKPVLAVKSGRTEVGQRAGRSHTAAAATSDVVIDALFRRSGVLRMGSMQEMLDTARVLMAQPLPAGPRLAVVGNSGGPEILAADAAAEAGLVVADFDEETTSRLVAMEVPSTNPIDLGAGVSAARLRDVLKIVASSSSVDALLCVFTEIAVTEVAETRHAVRSVAADCEKTFVSVAAGAADRNIALPGSDRALPVFCFPEAAALALAAAYRYTRMRDASAHRPARPGSTDPAGATQIVNDALSDGRSWLTADEVHRLLTAYGLPVCPQAVVSGYDGARAAAREFGYPVVAKLAEAGLHKTDVGGVRIGIEGDAELRTAVEELERLAPGPLLIQPMVDPGTELILGSVHDDQCGPVLMLGAGGVLTDIVGDRTFALPPVDDRDAEDMIGRLRIAKLLDGFRGAPAVSRQPVRDALVRVAALVDDVPEIAELDINPLICRADGVDVVDARIRVAVPPAHPDPLVRQLRAASR